MVRKTIILLMAGGTLLGLFGCAAKQVAQEPEVPVFRYENYVHNEGFRGKFAFENHEVITVMPDRKNTDSTFKWTGAILGRVMSEKRRVNIVRLDKDLAWEIDINKKRYLEYPIKKTAAQVGILVDDPSAETVYIEDCAKCQSSMKRTGSKKVVNGYDAEQVILSLKCREEKQPGEAPSTTTITLDIWMASGVQMGGEMDAFDKAYAQKLGMDMKVQISAAAGEAMTGAFPMLKDLGLMMKDLKGYPILSTLSIENDQYLKKAEEDRKKRDEQESKKEISTSPTEMVTGFLGKKWKERQDAKQKEEDLKWGNVIWRVSWESRNFNKMNITASTFNLPEGLKKVEQKEYLEGDQGKAVVEYKPAHYVHTTCLSSVTEAQLGAPIYPGAGLDRETPYNESHRNTNWYYKSKDDYRIRYATEAPMDKVVSFYEGKLKTKCSVTKRKNDGQEYTEAVCTQPLGGGKVRTFRMDEKPIEISVGTQDIQETTSAASSAKKLLGFELSVQKGK